MDCTYKSKLNPNTDSLLYSELSNNFSTEEEINHWFAFTETEWFLNNFGDWKADYDREEGTKLLNKQQVNKIDEPKLEVNEFGYPYFIMKDNSKYFLGRKILNLPYTVREALIQSSLYEIFGDNIGSPNAEILDNLDIDSVFNSTEHGSIASTLKYNAVDIADLKKLVLERINRMQITIVEKEDSFDPERDISYDDVTNEASFDSVAGERNTKDNASANIKFFLSFIPEMKLDQNGNIDVLERTEILPDGTNFQYLAFYPFDQIYNKFVTSLQDMTITYNSGNYTGIFNEMIDKLLKDHPKDASVVYATSLLKEMNEFKQNEFVQAFLLHRQNYDTNTIKKESVGIKHTTFQSDRAVTPAKKIASGWNANFKKTKLITVSGDKLVFNKDRATKLSNNFNKLVEEVRSDIPKKLTEEETNNVLYNYTTTISSYLNEIGINISEEALSSFTASNNNPNRVRNLFDAVSSLKFIFQDISNLSQPDVIKNNEVENIIISTKDKLPGTRIRQIAEHEANFKKDLAENTILGAEGKKYYLYAYPSYLSNKILRLKADPDSELPANTGFYQNSIILNKFRDTINNIDFIKNFKLLTFGNYRQENVADEGTDNKGITFPDQLTDQINKTLGVKKGGNEVSTYYTPTPADKGRLLELAGMDFYSNTRTPKGNVNDVILDIMSGYIIDELSRISDDLILLQDVEGNKDKLYKDAHYKLDKNGKPYYYDSEGKPVGNAFKSILFPEFNPFNPHESIKGLFTDNELNITHEAFKSNRQVKQLINDSLLNTIESNRIDLINQNVLVYTKDGVNFSSLDSRIMSQYLIDSNNNKEEAINQAISDYVLNSMIANIEFSKVFSGDYTYYKDLVDLSKRYPGTYTDGIQLNLKEGDPANFKLAVLPNVIISSHTLTEIKASSPRLASAYSRVNATDAQGWITLDRWKFIMERSNHWGPKFEEAFQRFQSNTQTELDYKLAAQPIKGVFFSNDNGTPTYIKYSAAVLIPSAIRGTSLERLNQAMIDQGVSESVVIDGIKVGAIVPSDVLTDTGKLKEGPLQLNTISLRNNNYKIQQDLRPKGVKQTLIGSQFKKIILSNLKLDGDYNGLTGDQVQQEFNNILSDLSNKGLQKLTQETGIDSEGNITDRNKLTSKIIESLEERGGVSSNLIDALKKEFDYDYIASHRQKIQNTVMSIINNGTVKLKSNGGSFIQMSSWGIDEFEAEDEIGIKWLGDNKPSNLKAPNIVNGKVKPGQIFITSNYIAKFIPNWKELPPKDLKAIIDKRLLRLIGYRIPNQGMSSNDSLEIVGILPESYGDVIIPYVDITTKTGSDFDIDKMYVMIPNGEMKDGKLKYITYNKKKNPSEQSKEAVENRLIELSQAILESPLTYEAMMNPLDSVVLRDDINELHGDESKQIVANKFFSPTYQLQKKFDNAGGKTGIGIVANQLVDHTWTQLKDVFHTSSVGFGHVSQDGYTFFNEEYDINGEYKITDVLSWFLTAYVDIAKDPYISKGNHNDYTANTVLALIRAGSPIKFINRLVGQEGIKELAKVDSLRKSRIGTPSFISLRDEVIVNLTDKYGFSYNDINGIKDKKSALQIIKEVSEGNRKDNILKFQERLEKDINSNPKDEQWMARQLEYIDLFLNLRAIGQDLSESVLASKQDVNGGGKDAISALVDRNRVEAAKRGNIIGFEDKFDDTFLGTAYNNSTELAISVMGKLFVTANESARDLYNATYRLIQPGSQGLTNADLGFEMEKAYFAHILGQSVFSRPVEEVNSLFQGPNSVYDRLVNLRTELSDNYFLNKLDIATKSGYKFVKMDSTKNSSPEELNEISRSWQELLESNREDIRQLGEDLITYAFYQSSFRSNIGSFFEYIPVDRLKDIVEVSVNEAKTTYGGGNNNVVGFVDKFFRHNWKNDQVIPYASSKGISQGVLTVTKGGKFRPYVKTSTDSTYEGGIDEVESTSTIRLWKNVALNLDREGNIKSATFIPVSKLGMSEEGNNIYEYNHEIPVDGLSMIKSNNAGVDLAKRDVIMNKLRKGFLDGTRIEYNIINSTVNDLDIQQNNRNNKKDLNKGLNDGLVEPEC